MNLQIILVDFRIRPLDLGLNCDPGSGLVSLYEQGGINAETQTWKE